jgi:hypothetical protein
VISQFGKPALPTPAIQVGSELQRQIICDVCAVAPERFRLTREGTADAAGGGGALVQSTGVEYRRVHVPHVWSSTGSPLMFGMMPPM